MGDGAARGWEIRMECKEEALMKKGFNGWAAGQWVEFDDEKPILRKEEDITALSGGGEECGSYSRKLCWRQECSHPN